MASIEKRKDKPSQMKGREEENSIESSVYSEKENAEIQMALTNQHMWIDK